MEHIIIKGKNPLEGTINISGSKNAAVAIVPAAIAANGICVIDNLPKIDDIKTQVRVLEALGAKCEYQNSETLVIDSSSINKNIVDEKFAKKLRASYYFMGALLGRFKCAEVPLPGGCDIGSRSIDYHLKGFTALGATCEQEHGIVKIKADKLRGAHIYLDCPSVGATINIMMAAVFAEGITIIENAAKEPHIVDTANFMNKLGARITAAGTGTIRIFGVKNLRGGEYTVIPDPIETGTYMIAAAITVGNVELQNIIPKHMESVTAKLREIGCSVAEGSDWLRIKGTPTLRPTELKTAFYPGFPTDLQPQMTTLLCLAQGSSTIIEDIFEHRFRYTSELKRLGAQIKVVGRTATTKGYGEYTGAKVKASDLRAGASLIIAGLAARGTTTIGNLGHLDRGYERIEEKLRSLGADIERRKT